MIVAILIPFSPINFGKEIIFVDSLLYLIFELESVRCCLQVFKSGPLYLSSKGDMSLLNCLFASGNEFIHHKQDVVFFLLHLL